MIKHLMICTISLALISACGGGGGGGGDKGPDPDPDPDGLPNPTMSDYHLSRTQVFDFKTNQQSGDLTRQNFDQLPGENDIVFSGGTSLTLGALLDDDAVAFANSEITINLASQKGSYSTSGFIVVNTNNNTLLFKAPGGISSDNFSFSDGQFSADTAGTITINGVKYNLSGELLGGVFGSTNSTDPYWIAISLDGDMTLNGRKITGYQGIGVLVEDD